MTGIKAVRLTITGMRAIQETREFNLVGPDGSAVDTLVAAGPNGSGKTTFLEAILLGLGRGDLIAAAGHGDTPAWRCEVPPGARLVLDLEVSSATGTVLGTLAPCRVRIMRKQGETAARLITSDEKETDLDTSLLAQILAEISVQYFSSWRNPQLSGAVAPSDRHRDAKGSETARLVRMKQTIVNERAARSFAGAMQFRDEAWLKKINEFWERLHPGSQTFIEAEVVDRDALERTFDLYVCRKTEFGNERVWPLDQGSSGELEMLSLIGTLIVEDFEGILIIDEPELHLHPEWQGIVLESLRSALPGSQLIIGTHSDQVWDHVFSFERVLLVPDGDPRAVSVHYPASGSPDLSVHSE